MVEWRVVGGTVIEGLDFMGVGDIFIFVEGELCYRWILVFFDKGIRVNIMVMFINTLFICIFLFV